MEPDQPYDVQGLRRLAADAGVERLREVMHELWVHREVERVGHSGWRRHRSAPAGAAPPPVRQARLVKPEELFDHDAFEEFFK
jgi:hypothetical protein